MRFSTDYLYCFHYSDGMGYLIFCCHSVAKNKSLGQVLNISCGADENQFPVIGQTFQKTIGLRRTDVQQIADIAACDKAFLFCELENKLTIAELINVGLTNVVFRAFIESGAEHIGTASSRPDGFKQAGFSQAFDR